MTKASVLQSGSAWEIASILSSKYLLDYLRDDPETQVIGIFIEGSANPRTFLKQVASLASQKPVVVYKGGRGENADRVTITHTGAAAGASRIWEGALRQAGAELVNSISEMVSVCKALSIGKPPKGKRLGIFTHTAGPSIVAWDILGREPGCELAQLQKQTIERIAEILGPSVPVVHKNPVDGAAGAFLPEPYQKISEAVLKDPSVDAMLAIFCEHKNWIYPSDVLIEVASQFSKTVVACFIGSVKPISQDRDKLHAAGIPTYVLPEDAAIGMRALLRRVK